VLWEALVVNPDYRLLLDEALTDPALVAALDGWVDAGSAGTLAAGYLARGGDKIVTFDPDAFVDYRARRPNLQIQQGVLTEMTWPEIAIYRVRHDKRDLLVLTGPEPDYRWAAFRDAVVEIAERFGVVQSVCLGAIPALVAHTHATPTLVTGRERGTLQGDLPLPGDLMQVPSSAVNLVEVYLAERGIPSVGIWAQVPHYVEGRYLGAALALVERVARHLGITVSVESMIEDVRKERTRLDAVVAGRPEAKAYLQQLEASGPVAPVVSPSEDIAAEVERFLREATGGGTSAPADGEPPGDGG
jgi:predicted ATP-grasp superfamily ATP-dependent carboligase